MRSGLSGIVRVSNAQSRSITAENVHGRKGGALRFPSAGYQNAFSTIPAAVYTCWACTDATRALRFPQAQR